MLYYISCFDSIKYFCSNIILYQLMMIFWDYSEVVFQSKCENLIFFCLYVMLDSSVLYWATVACNSFSVVVFAVQLWSNFSRHLKRFLVNICFYTISLTLYPASCVVLCKFDDGDDDFCLCQLVTDLLRICYGGNWCNGFRKPCQRAVAHLLWTYYGETTLNGFWP